ncbi:MAG TPA: hypothetical protein VFB39_14725 [Solirubrobacteraceae bacterium]|nr:hypothetical protein [Solirubrobacteraceae bacterium]
MSTGSDDYFYNLQTVRSDPRLAYVLLKEARSRTLERVFGTPRDQQFLLTLILLGMTGRAVAARANWIRRIVPHPTRSDVLIGNSLLDEAAHMIAGDSTLDTPLVGSLVAFALLAALARPGVDDIRTAARTVKAELARIPQFIVRLNEPDESQSSR